MPELWHSSNENNMKNTHPRKKIEKIEEYKARQVELNTYETSELILENMSKKINELIVAFNSLPKHE